MYESREGNIYKSLNNWTRGFIIPQARNINSEEFHTVFTHLLSTLEYSPLPMEDAHAKTFAEVCRDWLTDHEKHLPLFIVCLNIFVAGLCPTQGESRGRFELRGSKSIKEDMGHERAT